MDVRIVKAVATDKKFRKKHLKVLSFLPRRGISVVLFPIVWPMVFDLAIAGPAGPETQAKRCEGFGFVFVVPPNSRISNPKYKNRNHLLSQSRER